MRHSMHCPGAPLIRLSGAAIFVLLFLSTAPARAQLPEYILVPTVRIGSIDDPESALTTVLALATAPDGRIALLQSQDENIWIFSPAGKRVAVVGREGEGPGEFRSVAMLGWLGDTLWVADGALYRVTFFPPGGGSPRMERAERLEQLTRVPLPAGGGRWLTVRQTLSDTRLRKYSQELWSLDSAWQPVLRLAAFPPSPDRVVIASGGASRLVDHPFGTHPLFAMAPDVSSTTIVERTPASRSGRSARYTVTRLGSRGDTLFHREFAARAEPITRRTRSAVIEEFASLEGLQRGAPSLSALRSAIVDSLRLPDTHPPISKVLVGTDGSTWLRGPDDWSGTVRWQVLDTAGEPVRTVIADRHLGIHSNQGFSIMAADRDGVWGTVHDDLGVTYLVRYDLRPRNPARQ